MKYNSITKVNICSFFRLHTTRKTPSTHTCVKWWHCRSSRQSIYQTPSTALKWKPPTKTIQDVLNYAYRTWINNIVFSVEYWSVFMTSIRTNNDVEGWHNRINYRVAARGPVPFYSLLTELYSEAADIPLQLKMVTEGKLQRYQRRHTRQIQGKLFTLWYQYCNNTISASRLLKECAGAFMVHHRSNFVDNEHCVFV